MTESTTPRARGKHAPPVFVVQGKRHGEDWRTVTWSDARHTALAIAAGLRRLSSGRAPTWPGGQTLPRYQAVRVTYRGRIVPPLEDDGRGYPRSAERTLERLEHQAAADARELARARRV